MKIHQKHVQKCGEMSKNYNNRIKECLYRKYKLNREYIGSCNIYIKKMFLNYKNRPIHLKRR